MDEKGPEGVAMCIFVLVFIFGVQSRQLWISRRAGSTVRILRMFCEESALKFFQVFAVRGWGVASQ